MSRAFLGLGALLATSCGEVTTNGNDNPPPTIESISPARGGVPGGHTITITGSGFTANDAGDNHVVAGELAATDVVAVDDATLTFSLPPGAAPDAIVDITVFNNNGYAVLPDAVQYSPFPVALSLSTGYVRSSGDDIRLFGSGFEAFDAGDNFVTIGGTEIGTAQVVSDSELAIEVPERPDGIAAFAPLDVMVTNGNGTTTLPGALKYTKPGLLRLEWDGGNPGITKVWFVDLESESVDEILITTANALAHSAALANNGRIYITSRGTRATGVTRTLSTLDPLTGATQLIGPLVGSPQDDIRDITFDNGVMYGLMRDGQRLAAIDLDDASYSPIGAEYAYPEGSNTPGENDYGYPLAMTRRNDSSLWAGKTLQSNLWRVSTSSSATELQVALAGEVSARLNTLVVLDGDLYATTNDSAVIGEVGQSLVRIDTTTGAVTHLKQFTGYRSAIVPTPPLF